MKWLGTVLAWCILAGQVFAEDTAANPARQAPVATVPLGCSSRADDKALSPDGRKAWICAASTDAAKLPRESKEDPPRGEAGNGLPPPKGLRDVGDFLAALNPRVAKGWEVSEVNYGPTFRGDWLVGWGFHVVVYDNEGPESAGPRPFWTDVHVWVLDRQFGAKGPFARDQRPIEEIARWRGRRVMIYGGKERWPTRRADVLAAIQATDKPAAGAAPIQQRFQALAKFVTALAPRVHPDWHCSEFRYGRDQISNPGVTEGWGCHVILRQRLEENERPGPDGNHGNAQIWLMDPSFDGRLPKKTRKNFVPDELGRWHDGRTFVWGYVRGQGNWHIWRHDLQAALGASDPAIKPMSGDDAAKRFKQLSNDYYGMVNASTNPERWCEAVAQRKALLPRLKEAAGEDAEFGKEIARLIKGVEDSIACDGVDVLKAIPPQTPSADPLAGELDAVCWAEEDRLRVGLGNPTETPKQASVSLRNSTRSGLDIRDWPVVARAQLEVAPGEVVVVHFDDVPDRGNPRLDWNEQVKPFVTLLENGHQPRTLELFVQNAGQWVNGPGACVRDAGTVRFAIPAKTGGWMQDVNDYHTFVAKTMRARRRGQDLPLRLTDRTGVVEAEHGYFFGDRLGTCVVDLPETDRYDLVSLSDFCVRTKTLLWSSPVTRDFRNYGPRILQLGTKTRVRRVTATAATKNTN